MKRILTAALVAAAIAAPTTAEAKPNHRGPCQNLEMRETIICAEKLWPVAAGVDALLYIADRESGFYEGAVSPSGTYLGVFQIGSYHVPSWPVDVMNRQWFHRWFRHLSWSDPASLLNGRFNVFLAVRFASVYGLGPWGG